MAMAAARLAAAGPLLLRSAAASSAGRLASTLSESPFGKATTGPLAEVNYNAKPGVDVALNWSLAKGGITPSVQSYRNPDDELLLGGAASLQAPPSAAGCTALSSGGALPGSLPVNNDVFGEVKAAATDAISASARVFVADAAVGAHRSAELRVRAVTDCPAAALFLRHMLSTVPLRPVEEWTDGAAITVVHASLPDPAAEGAYTATLWDTVPGPAAPEAAEGEEAPPPSPDLRVGATVVARGDVPLTALAHALASAAAPLLLDDGGKLALPCDVRQAEEGAVTLVFAAPDPADSASAGALAGAHHAVWHAGGVSRMWDGVVSSKAPKAKAGGGVVSGTVELGAGLVAAPLRTAGANALPPPARLTFVEKADGKSTSMQPAEARSLFAERIAMLGGTDAELAAFDALLAAHGPTLHKVA